MRLNFWAHRAVLCFQSLLIVLTVSACDFKRVVEPAPSEKTKEPVVPTPVPEVPAPEPLPTPEFLINRGAAYTNNINVALFIGSENAAQMYITPVADCASEGTWVPYSIGLPWTLLKDNDSNTLYAKVRSAEGGESPCVSASIVHDSIAPNLTVSSPINHATIVTTAVTFMGTCETGISVKARGDALVTSVSGPCTNGTFSLPATFRSGEGIQSIVVSQQDLASNLNAVTLSLNIDNVAPTNNAIQINGGAAYTQVLGVTVAIQSSGASEIYLTQDASCTTGGSWQNYGTSKTWTLITANSLNTLYSRFRDTAGNVSACVSSAITHDNISPSLTFTFPADGTTVNSANASSFPVRGVCSDEGQIINLTGSLAAMGICSSGTWSLLLDTTPIADGTLTITVNSRDAAGNAASGVTRTFPKDTSVPTGLVLSINSGAAYTSNAAVQLGVTATGATQMYLTNVADCTGGGVWEGYASTKNWTLGQMNMPSNVYAKFRNAAGNETACINAHILHDDVRPSWTTAPVYANKHNSLSQSPSVTWSSNATDGGSGIAKYQYAVGTGTSGAALFDLKTWTDIVTSPFVVSGLSLSNGGTYYLHMRTIDRAGNIQEMLGAGWSVDATPPTLTLTSITNGVVSTEVDMIVSGSCENSLTVNASYGSDLSGPASVVCNSGVYSFLAESVASTGSRTITVSSSDSAGNVASISRTWKQVQFVEPNGTVLSVLPLADGSRIIGGQFTAITTSRSMHFQKVSSAGVIDPSLEIGAGFNGQVLVVAAIPSDGGYIVGGNFTTYRRQTANRIAKIFADGTLDTNFSPQGGSVNGLDAIVQSVAISGTDVFIGGQFTKYRNAPANRIAKVSLTSGALNTTFNPATGNNGVNGTVYAVRVDGTSLYLGGSFTTYKAAAANRVAKVNTSTGALDTTFNPASGANGANNTVFSLEVGAADLYIGGQFTTYRGATANRIAKIGLSSGVMNTTFSPSSGNNGANNIVYGISIEGDELIIGGTFTTYRGGVANRLAKVDALTGDLNLTFNPATGGNGVDNTVSTIDRVGTDLYIGGLFTAYRGARALQLAKLDPSTGSLDTTFNPASGANGTNGSVDSVFVTSDGGLLLGGAFSQYRPDQTANYIAKITPAGILDTTFNPASGANGANGVVRTLATDGTFVYVGGDFTLYRGGVANRVAKVDISTGALNTTFNPVAGNNGVNNVVYSLSLNGADLYLGGSFTTYRAGVANRVAKITASTGALNTTFSPASGANGANNIVNSVLADGADLYIGGQFTTYRGVAAKRVAKITASTGALNTTFNPSSGANGANNTVSALAISGTDLYVGGTFTTYRGGVANRVAKIVASTGALDLTFNPASGANGAASTVNAIQVAGSKVLIGGAFTQYRGVPANYLAQITASTGALDTNFNPASGGNGTSGAVSALAWDADKWMVGGVFETYRGGTTINYVEVAPTGVISAD